MGHICTVTTECCGVFIFGIELCYLKVYRTASVKFIGVFLSGSLGLIALHAGIPLVVSQSTLTLMFVVLAIIVIGVGFGLIARSHEGFLQHRWAMSVATALALSVIFLVFCLPLTTFILTPIYNSFRNCPF